MSRTPIIELIRTTKTDKYTLGVLNVLGVTRLFTLERPWKNNLKYESCIPTGTYQASILPISEFPQSAKKYPKQHHLIALHDVKGRSGILVHPGSFLSNTKGCILVGSKLSRTWKAEANPVLLSTNDALTTLIDYLRDLHLWAFEFSIRDSK